MVRTLISRLAIVVAIVISVCLVTVSGAVAQTDSETETIKEGGYAIVVALEEFRLDHGHYPPDTFSIFTSANLRHRPYLARFSLSPDTRGVVQRPINPITGNPMHHSYGWAPAEFAYIPHYSTSDARDQRRADGYTLIVYGADSQIGRDYNCDGEPDGVLLMLLGGEPLLDMNQRGQPYDVKIGGETFVDSSYFEPPE